MTIHRRRAQRIKELLEKTFRRHHEAAGPASQDQRTHDFVFHMTDWYSDLIRLAKLMEHPERWSDREWNEVVYGFVIHVSGHLAAAAHIAGIEPIQFHVPTSKGARRRRKTSIVSR